MQFKPVTLLMGQQIDINQTLPVDQLQMTQFFLKPGYQPASNPEIRDQPYNPYELITGNGLFGIRAVLGDNFTPNHLAVYTHQQLTKTLGFNLSTDLPVDNSDTSLNVLSNAVPVFPQPDQTLPAIDESNQKFKLNLVSELLWDNQHADSGLYHGYVLAMTVAGQSGQTFYYLDQQDQWKQIDLADWYNTDNSVKIRQTAKFHLYYYASIAPLGSLDHLVASPLSTTQSKLTVLGHTNEISVNSQNVWSLDAEGQPTVNHDLTGKQLIFHLLPFVFKFPGLTPPILFQESTNQLLAIGDESNYSDLVFTNPVLNYRLLADFKRSHLYMAQRFNPDSNYTGEKRIWGMVYLTQLDGRQIGMFNMATVEEVHR